MSVTAANRLDPDVTFLCHCNPCPHMKRMTLPGIRHALETMTREILIDPALATRARSSA
jgi:quinolinate synthase